eukprot:PLAT6116.1.p1 GENE.PLAT6116.1~~PLAT6116.1.p1  ORF type:complete len:714 (-),score=221.41 PLAT6116.1:1396-3339(-)
MAYDGEDVGMVKLRPLDMAKLVETAFSELDSKLSSKKNSSRALWKVAIAKVRMCVRITRSFRARTLSSMRKMPSEDGSRPSTVASRVRSPDRPGSRLSAVRTASRGSLRPASRGSSRSFGRREASGAAGLKAASSAPLSGGAGHAPMLSSLAPALEFSFKHFDAARVITCLAPMLELPAAARDLDLMRELLEGIDFFDNLTDKIRDAVFRVMSYASADADEVLFRQGDQGRYFYVILRGEVDVIVSHLGVEFTVCTLGNGQSFGELALSSERPRAATIVTSLPCHFACIDKADYQRILDDMHSKEHAETLDFLCNVPMFRESLRKPAIRSWISMLRVERYAQGSIIAKQGSFRQLVYLVRAGDVRVVRKLQLPRRSWAEKRRYVLVDVCTLGSGDYFGVDAQLLQARDWKQQSEFSAHYIASSAVLALVCSASEFRSRCSPDMLNWLRLYAPLKEMDDKLLFQQLQRTRRWGSQQQRIVGELAPKAVRRKVPQPEPFHFSVQPLSESLPRLATAAKKHVSTSPIAMRSSRMLRSSSSMPTLSPLAASTRSSSSFSSTRSVKLKKLRVVKKSGSLRESLLSRTAPAGKQTKLTATGRSAKTRRKSTPKKRRKKKSSKFADTASPMAAYMSASGPVSFSPASLVYMTRK